MNSTCLQHWFCGPATRKNVDEIGKIIDFALKQKCVRGITFQR